MGRKKDCVQRKNKVRTRRRRIIVPLNLPDKIWQQYTKSLKETTNSPLYTESKNDNKSLTKDNEFHATKTINAINTVGNESSILKQLSVKIDNSYAVQFNCLYLNEKLNKALEIQKSIYEKVMNAKQVFNKLSIQTVIYKKGKECSAPIIHAESELDNSLNLLEKQELQLLNLQKTFHEISVPLSVLTYYNIEQDNMLRMSASISKKENEIDILKHKNDFLENKLRKNEKKLLKTKQTYQNIIKTKDLLLLETKKKLYLMKKRMRMMTQTNNRTNTVHNSVQSLQIHAQFENLMTLTKSLKENILENQSHICLCNNEATQNTDGIIDNLNNQLRDLQQKSKQKDNELRKLLISERQLKKQIFVFQEKSNLQDKQNKFEIMKLTSSIDNLRRKHDRWLADRFHQKCLSIMLFEKLKQIEMQQNKSALFCFKKIEKNSDDKAFEKT